VGGLEDLRLYGRYAAGLREFFRHQLSPADGAAIIQRQRAGRDQNFLQLLEHGVFAQPGSPYRRLLEHNGIELGDVEALVSDYGLEDALERLCDEGVYVKLDEVKGRRAVTRPGIEFPVSERDFDNPLLIGHFEAKSGGSRSRGRRTVVDLAHLEFEAAQSSLFEAAFPFGPLAAWYPAPPSAAGVMTMLAAIKAGWPVERWFSQLEIRGPASGYRDALLTATTRIGARLWAPRRIPAPEYAPLAEPLPVVEWLAEKRAGGHPGTLVTYPSAAVKACATAIDAGIDIDDSVFILGGEPYTAEKAAVVERAGARGVSFYGMTESGSIGMPCGKPEVADDVHVLAHKVGIVRRATDVGGASVDGLFVTTLLPSSPKLMLNAESGDYAVLEERDCGCAIGEAGLTLHLHSIRSHEKLTSQGMTFLGDELIELIDRLLPAKYGGRPDDYQLVEEETPGGVPHVTLVVRPRLGELSERELIETVLEQLGSRGRAQRMMAETWRAAGALRVARREPHLTAGGKVVPLHLLLDRTAPPGGVST
jgi:hypothetical protein